MVVVPFEKSNHDTITSHWAKRNATHPAHHKRQVNAREKNIAIHKMSRACRIAQCHPKRVSSHSDVSPNTNNITLFQLILLTTLFH